MARAIRSTDVMVNIRLGFIDVLLVRSLWARLTETHDRLTIFDWTYRAQAKCDGLPLRYLRRCALREIRWLRVVSSRQSANTVRKRLTPKTGDDLVGRLVIQPFQRSQTQDIVGPNN